VRVVSLVPSVTETLLAWGLEPVAVTRFCEQPSFATVGGTKDPDVTAIVALAPDLVVVNDEENRREDAEALEAAGLRLHVTRVRSVDDVEPTLADLARAVGVERAGADVTRPSLASEQRRAFVPIWRRPWMTMNADTYGSSLLANLGVTNVFADDADRYPGTTLEEAARRRPDVVLAPTEPYPFKPRHLPELQQVAADARIVDGRDLFWWGVRTAGALDRLAEELAGPRERSRASRRRGS
jgi:ABC-type Fe3+-hydroxamate transport system substrate-binding protein